MLIGPLTLLLIGKGVNDFDPMALLSRLATAYRQVLKSLAAESVPWVQIDEPMLVTDLDDNIRAAYRKVYAELAQVPVKLMLATYFGSLGDNLQTAVDLGTAGLHIDGVRAPQQPTPVLNALTPAQSLSIGCVDGRNIWLTDFSSVTPQLAQAANALGPERVIVAPSCSLLHVLHDLRDETTLAPRIRNWLRFATEKLSEVMALEMKSRARQTPWPSRTAPQPNLRQTLECELLWPRFRIMTFSAAHRMRNAPWCNARNWDCHCCPPPPSVPFRRPRKYGSIVRH